MQKWKVDFLNGKELNSLTIKMKDKDPKIEVGVENSGKLFASVECFLCNRFIKLYLCNSDTVEGTIHFKNGNLVRHLKTHFRQ